MNSQSIGRSGNAAKLWYLKKISLFVDFSMAEMKELEQMTEMQSYRKGEVLYLPGEPGDRLYMLKSGVVKISRLVPDGHELTLALLKPGDIFGEVEVVGDEPHEAQAIAYDNVLLCIVKSKDFTRWMEQKPKFAMRVTKLIGFRRHRIESHIEKLLFRSAASKLAALLLDLKEQFGDNNKQPVIKLSLTHQELANLTGSVRETISDLLTRFRDENWIVIDRKRIKILDLSALKKTAQES